MKYVTGIIGGLFIFLAVWFLVGLVLAIILPDQWKQPIINIGELSGNLPSLVGLILGGLAAAATFKASLNAKTGKLYRKPEQPKK